MKKELLLFTTLFSSTFCTSQNEKIDTLIDRYMYKTLSDYQSYEPVETSEPDSLLTTLFTDKQVMSFAKKYAVESVSLKAKIFELEYKIEESKQALNMGEAERAEYELEKYEKELKAQTAQMKKLITEFKPEHIGWKVSHTYRSKVLGFSTIREIELELSKDLRTIKDGNSFSFITDMFDDASTFIEDFIENEEINIRY